MIGTFFFEFVFIWLATLLAYVIIAEFCKIELWHFETWDWIVVKNAVPVFANIFHWRFEFSTTKNDFNSVERSMKFRHIWEKGRVQDDPGEGRVLSQPRASSDHTSLVGLETRAGFDADSERLRTGLFWRQPRNASTASASRLSAPYQNATA